eukprot:6492273-Amphidinium_carterae.1
MPSEPTARIDALTVLETPLKSAKSFQEALKLLRVTPLLSSLFHDPQFNVAHANILAVTGVKTRPDVNNLWQYIELVEAELNERGQEEAERNRRKPQGHYTDVPQAPGNPKGNKDGMGGGKDKKGKDQKGKEKRGYRNRDDDPADTRPICPDFLTDRGCPKGGQCTQRHPTKVGKCLRCGAKGHSVAECRRPRRDNPRNPK